MRSTRSHHVAASRLKVMPALSFDRLSARRPSNKVSKRASRSAAVGCDAPAPRAVFMILSNVLAKLNASASKMPGFLYLGDYNGSEIGI